METANKSRERVRNGDDPGEIQMRNKGNKSRGVQVWTQAADGGGGMDHISGPAAWTEGVQEPDVSRQTLLVRPGPETLKAKAR